MAGLWSTGFLLSGFGTLSMISQMQGTFGVSQGSPLMLFPLVQIIGAPIVFVLLSIAARVYLEFAMAVFRIAENTEVMRRQD